MRPAFIWNMYNAFQKFDDQTLRKGFNIFYDAQPKQMKNSMISIHLSSFKINWENINEYPGMVGISRTLKTRYVCTVITISYSISKK
jgi:hypothetical protein